MEHYKTHYLSNQSNHKTYIKHLTKNKKQLWINAPWPRSPFPWKRHQFVQDENSLGGREAMGIAGQHCRRLPLSCQNPSSCSVSPSAAPTPSPSRTSPSHPHSLPSGAMVQAPFQSLRSDHMCTLLKHFTSWIKGDWWHVSYARWFPVQDDWFSKHRNTCGFELWNVWSVVLLNLLSHTNLWNKIVLRNHMATLPEDHKRPEKAFERNILSAWWKAEQTLLPRVYCFNSMTWKICKACVTNVTEIFMSLDQSMTWTTFWFIICSPS